LPWKIRELMLILEIEVSKRYRPKIVPVETESRVVANDTTLD